MLNHVPNRSFFLTIPLSLGLIACHRNSVIQGDQLSRLSSFTVGELETKPGMLEWQQMRVEMHRQDIKTLALVKDISHTNFKQQKFEDMTLRVPYGSYQILVTYRDQTGKMIYESCAAERSKNHEIQLAVYETKIEICQLASDNQVGKIESMDISKVTITPKLEGTSSKGSPAQDPNTSEFIEQCLRRNYGFSSSPINFSKTRYPKTAESLALDQLSVNASTKELKAFIGKVYDQFPLFKSVYESELGLTRSQALVFMFADISRESGKDGYWQIALETGLGKDERGRDNSAHAWGPFQAAVTNFYGAGYDDEVLIATGLPVPQITQFYDPATSTYAGMKRLAEGILKAAEDFGSGKEAKTYLLGSLAHHNTGHTNAALESNWISFYGAETLRLMQGYLAKDNLVNNRAFWTTEPTDSICNKYDQ